jgi:tetratricopeptide (TPR) repeat protein
VYQRGQYLGSRDRPDLLTAARDAFAEAARMDPEFAAAIAQEGETLVEMSFAGALRFREGLSLARDAARRAIAKGAGPGTAARVMGVATLFLEWDFEGSQRWLDRAAVNRADAKTSMARAIWFAAAGRADEAVESAEQAVALDPASYYVRADLAMFYLGAGRNADAAESSRRVLGVAPDFVPARLYAIAASERLDQWSEAAGHARALMASGGASAAELAALERVDARAAVTLWRRWDLSRLEQQAAGRREDYALHLALRHAALGDRVTALDELSVALERRHALLVFLRSFPELTGLRGDPAFEAIARALTPGHAPLSAGHPSSD